MLIKLTEMDAEIAIQALTRRIMQVESDLRYAESQLARAEAELRKLKGEEEDTYERSE
jgi:predicted  nucleic acid-binding Zn-ribbon protein